MLFKSFLPSGRSYKSFLVEKRLLKIAKTSYFTLHYNTRIPFLLIFSLYTPVPYFIRFFSVQTLFVLTN